MRILHVGSEIFPLVKTGGLADVLAALPPALVKRGLDVRVLLPGLPGTPLIFLAAFGHKLWLGDRSVSWWIVVLMGGITLATLVVDYLATAYGAQRMGATWRGVVGAVVGAMLPSMMLAV